MASPKPETIKSLAKQYNVCRQTFEKWLQPFKADLNLQEGVKVLTPLQVSIIYSKLDPPETTNNHEQNKNQSINNA